MLCTHPLWSSLTLWVLWSETRPSFRDKNQLTLAPPLPNTHAVQPSPTAQGLGQSRACWDGVRIGGGGKSGSAGMVPPGLTGGKECDCCVSDWWEQACGRGIECCSKDILLAHPALSDAWPPALRTRLIGTPNCPYEYFSSEQEWKSRVGGLVSRIHSMTRERERQGERQKINRNGSIESPFSLGSHPV